MLIPMTIMELVYCIGFKTLNQEIYRIIFQLFYLRFSPYLHVLRLVYLPTFTASALIH